MSFLISDETCFEQNKYIGNATLQLNLDFCLFVWNKEPTANLSMALCKAEWYQDGCMGCYLRLV